MTLNKVKKETVKIVDGILSNSSVRLGEIANVLKTHFSSTKLSEVETAYETAIASQPDSKNLPLITAIHCYVDIISETIDQIQTMERYIMLHIPQMEDGNNFGVTVQMTVAKALKESREALSKKLDAIPAYYSSRADAVDKLGLVKTTVSTTKTTSASNAKGGKDGDENKSSESNVQEEKTVGAAGIGENMKLRLMHMVALDVHCYFNLRSGLVECQDSYMMILDNVEKNKDKLTAPKGSMGGNSMGMY